MTLRFKIVPKAVHFFMNFFFSHCRRCRAESETVVGTYLYPRISEGR